jgi:hypothetical protein
MKNQVLMTLISAGFVALLGTTPALAQSVQTATIPFAFVVGGAEYPSGTYVLAQNAVTRTVALTSASTLHQSVFNAAILACRSPNYGDNPKLVFNQSSAGVMQLREVWFPGRPGMLTTARDRPSPKHSRNVIVAMK